MTQTFTITIHSRKNNTWQGTLQTATQIIPFRSEMGLLMNMARQLPTETSASAHSK